MSHHGFYLILRKKNRWKKTQKEDQNIKELQYKESMSINVGADALRRTLFAWLQILYSLSEGTIQGWNKSTTFAILGSSLRENETLRNQIDEG